MVLCFTVYMLFYYNYCIPIFILFFLCVEMYASIKKKNKKTNWREKKRMRGFAEFFFSFINNTNLDGSNLILFGVFVF